MLTNLDVNKEINYFKNYYYVKIICIMTPVFNQNNKYYRRMQKKKVWTDRHQNV